MNESMLQMLLGVTLGLAGVLLLRRPLRRLFGAETAFLAWAMPPLLALAPFLPRFQSSAPDLVASAWLASVVASSPPVVAEPASSMPWAALWLLGAGLALAHLAVQHHRLLRAARRWNASRLSDLPDVARRTHPDRLRLHPAGPAVLWALPRPLLLMPADFASRFPNADTRQAIVEHELGHLRRGDAWSSLAMEVFGALLWFHPLVWLARGPFRLDMELACDAATLRHSTTGCARYARALLEASAMPPTPGLAAWLSTPHLKERLMMISHYPTRGRRRLGLLSLAVLATASMIGLAGLLPATASTSTVAAAEAAPVQSAREDASSRQQLPPRYPPNAVLNREEGQVVLTVSVSADGTPTAMEVDPEYTDAPASLQQAAMAAVAQWTFQPAEEDGMAIAGKVRVPITFSISDEDEDDDDTR